jgi:hypothetical protein
MNHLQKYELIKQAGIFGKLKNWAKKFEESTEAVRKAPEETIAKLVKLEEANNSQNLFQAYLRNLTGKDRVFSVTDMLKQRVLNGYKMKPQDFYPGVNPKATGPHSELERLISNDLGRTGLSYANRAGTAGLGAIGLNQIL